MTLAAYLHDLDPFAIRMWGDFGIRWYGLSYIAAFAVAFLVIRTLARRGKAYVPADQVADFVVAGAIGTVIGGRLGYCIFYGPQLLIEISNQFPFWGVLALNKGGMSSHGGMLGLLAACWLFSRKRHLKVWHLADLAAVCGGIGIFFGRLANFVNGELVGRPAPPDLPWAVKFPQDIMLWSPKRLENLTPVVAMKPIDVAPADWQAALHQLEAPPQDPAVMAFVRDKLAAVIEAVQSGNQQVAEALRPMLVARHPSQLYEALLEGLVLFLVLMTVWARPRKPGVVLGWFISVYAVLRIFGEQFRMPDEGIGYEALGLTRGQWLSVLMLAIGIAFLAWAVRRRAEPIGGWLTKQGDRPQDQKQDSTTDPVNTTGSKS